MCVKIITSLFVVLLSACSASGPIYQDVNPPIDGSSHLYIYRESAFANSLIAPGIILDDKEVFVLLNGGYSKFIIEPGIHSLSVKLSDKYKGNSEIVLEANPNRKIFVKLLTYNESAGASSFRRVFTLFPVDESMALKEIKECRYIDPQKSGKFEKSIFWADD